MCPQAEEDTRITKEARLNSKEEEGTNLQLEDNDLFAKGESMNSDCQGGVGNFWSQNKIAALLNKEYQMPRKNEDTYLGERVVTNYQVSKNKVLRIREQINLGWGGDPYFGVRGLERVFPVSSKWYALPRNQD